MIDAFERLDQMAESLDYALVGPADSRVHEIRTRRFPFNTICHLGRDFGDGRWRSCSGVLIGPRRILTAAHCLYSLKLGRAPVRVRVAPGRADRDAFPYGTLLATAAFVPHRFVDAQSQSERRSNDYGVLLLARPFRGLTRFLPLRALPDSVLRRTKEGGLLTVAGYPADRPLGTQWRHSERLRRFTPKRLLYTVDTCPGHSGSPVWIRLGEQRTLIGVHTSGILDEKGRSYGCAKGTVLAPREMMNSGVRINRNVLANLRDPLRRVGGARPMRRVL